MKTSITIIGFAGSDPTAKTFESGKSLIKFSVAVAEFKKGKSNTIWFEVQLWDGPLGAEISDYIEKGREMKIQGQLTFENYTDKGGNQVTKPIIVMSACEFMKPTDLEIECGIPSRYEVAPRQLSLVG
jgi:single stranded DNA-binding protein